MPNGVTGNLAADFLTGLAGGFRGGAEAAIALQDRRRRQQIEDEERRYRAAEAERRAREAALREAEFSERTGIRYVPTTIPEFRDPFQAVQDPAELMRGRIAEIRQGVGRQLLGAGAAADPLTTPFRAAPAPAFERPIEFGGFRKVGPSQEERQAAEALEREARLTALIGSTIARLRPELGIATDSPEAMALGTGRVPLPEPRPPVRGQFLQTDQGWAFGDLTTGEVRPVGIQTPKRGDTQASRELRREFTSDPIVKESTTVAQAYQRIKSVAESPSATNDLALIFSFMKMLDPNSVVREGEFATVENSQNVPDRFRSMYNRVLTGERLAPAARAEILASVDQLAAGQRQLLRGTIDRFSRYAQGLGVDPSVVVYDPFESVRTVEIPGAGPVPAAPATSTAPAAPAGATAATTPRNPFR